MILVLLLFPILFFALTYGVYRFAFYTPNRTQNDDLAVASTPQMEARREKIRQLISEARKIPYERVSIHSHDGLHLAGRYYRGQAGAPLYLCFHGYRGTPCRDFSGGIQIMRRSGYHILLVEERGHCSSEGHVITFGIRERLDVLDWVQFARERFGQETPIILVGISMGAATVLMASELALPEQVKGIIADCPYTSPREIIRKVCTDMKIPGSAGLWLAQVAARLYGRFDLSAAASEEAVRHAQVPILLIHGEQDHFVPCEMSRRIKQTAPDKIDLHTFPGAGHGLSFLMDPERYEKIIREFSEKVASQDA